ncbi:MAG: putative bifunctional diguanylate cyclase/phosphodiesterase [Sulfuricurvum sp.]
MNHLTNKLSLILIASIVIMSGILQWYFNSFLQKKYDETVERQVTYAFNNFNSHRLLLEKALKKGVSFVQEDESFIASVDLINSYQDKNNYDAILLDEEKKKIAQQLLESVKLSLNTTIIAYDHNEELLAYVIQTAQGYQLNFISYQNGKPLLLSRHENQAQYVQKPFIENTLIPFKHITRHNASGGTDIIYQEFANTLIITAHKTFFDTSSHKQLVHIEMSYSMGNAYFQSLSTDLNMHFFGSVNPVYKSTSLALHTISSQSLPQNDKNYILSIAIETMTVPFYVVAMLDKSFLTATLHQNRQTFYVLIITLSIIILFLLRQFLNRLVARPLEKLMVQIQKIERRDYSNETIVRTDDELEKISKNLNSLAKTIDEREKSLLQSQQQLEDLSNTDPLTNLANRRLYYAHLEHALDVAHRNGSKTAVIFVDLDNFKEINDTLGHDIGDELLQQVAIRLKSTLRASDTLARIGGDEFNILVEGVEDTLQIAHVAQKILNAFAPSFLCHENIIYITASIGISFFPDDANDVVSVVKYADLALYKSKNSGRNTFNFFSKDLSTYIEERTQYIHALKAAIDANDEFYLLYQPKVSPSTGKTVGVEALIRWKSPTLGMVYPDRFISIAEESGLIIPIGAWVLMQGCQDFMKLVQDGCILEQISINVSSIQLQKSDMLETLRKTFEKTGIKPHQLEIEITETYIATEQERALSTLQSLRDMGISLAIDDFGTGYSSMSYLQKLPVTRLKIDKSFVDDLPDSAESVAVVKAIIALAKTFNLSLTAEGVETQGQLEFLKEQQCDEIQGFYYSKPLELEGLKQFCLLRQ